MEPEPVIYQSDGVRIDTVGFRVERDGVACELEPRAFDLLVYLVCNAGRVVTKTQILDEVWGGVAVTDNALTRVVAQLRRVLGDDAREARFIETVPTRGYRWVPPVVEAVAVARDSDRPLPAHPSPGASPVADETAAAAARRGRSKLIYGAGIAVAITFVATASWWIARSVVLRSAQGGLPAARSASAFPVQVTTERALDLFPTVSPDASSMIFSSDRSGTFELYLKPLVVGSAITPLTHDGQQNVEPAWSPDGQLVAFHSMLRGGIWVMPALGGAARQVAPFGSAPAWSPDGRSIAFQSDPMGDLGPAAPAARPGSTIWTVTADGTGAPRALTRANEPAGGHASPIWTPDGTRVLFVNDAVALTELWSVDRDGGRPARLFSTGGAAYDAAFTRDRWRLIVAAGAGALSVLDIDRRAGPVTAPPAQIALASVDGVRYPAPTRDGRVLFSGIALESQLVALPIDPARGEPSGPARPITNSTARRTTSPAFSPDGNWVAYVSGARGAAADIWITRPDGSGTEPLTTSPEADLRPAWFPDSDGLSFVSSRRGVQGLWRTSRTSRRESLIARWPEVDPGASAGVRALQEPRMSPDGARIAYSALDPMTGGEQLRVRVLATGDDRAIASGEEGASYPCWSPDGRLIAFEAKRNGSSQIAVVPSGGGAVHLLTDTPGEHWVYSFSPDGSKVVSADLKDGVWNIAWTAIADGSRHVLTHYTAPGTFVRYPAWSPKGDLIVFEEARLRGNIWIASLP